MLVCTAKTKSSGQHFKAYLEKYVLTAEHPVEILCVDPYDILKTENELSSFLSEKKLTSEVVFNLTGGTKSMALAAYSIAEQMQSPFSYLQSEGEKNILHAYSFVEGKIRADSCQLPSLIDIDDYLNVHFPDGFKVREKMPNPDDGHRFEEIVASVLGGFLSNFQEKGEIKTSVEINNN